MNILPDPVLKMIFNFNPNDVKMINKRMYSFSKYIKFRKDKRITDNLVLSHDFFIKLVKVVIYGDDDISDTGLSKLVNLRMLKLSNDPNLTRESFDKLLKLKAYSVSNCPVISRLWGDKWGCMFMNLPSFQDDYESDEEYNGWHSDEECNNWNSDDEGFSYLDSDEYQENQDFFNDGYYLFNHVIAELNAKNASPR